MFSAPFYSKGLATGERRAYYSEDPVLQMDMLPFLSMVDCRYDDL